MTQNMFQIGNQNLEEANQLLGYLEHLQFSGMCSYLTGKSKEFLKNQEIFKDCKVHPVEFHVQLHLGHDKPSLITLDNTYSRYKYKNSKTNPYSQLRRWWCYNLAVAMSQGMC